MGHHSRSFQDGIEIVSAAAPSPSRGGVRGGGIKKDELPAGSNANKMLAPAKHPAFAKFFTPPLTPPRQGEGD